MSTIIFIIIIGVLTDSNSVVELTDGENKWYVGLK